MKSGAFAFGPFEIHVANRRLTRDGEPIDIGARYFDALALMVAAPGQLVTKERFIDEAWRGVPVTDEALTQGIRALRRALGDEAARPRYIETVPKHGYRFIAPVSALGGQVHVPVAALPARPAPSRLADIGSVTLAGSAGAALAGLVVGIGYGLAASGGAVGGLSLLLVLTLVTMTAALLGGVGIAFGLGLGEIDRRGFGRWSVAGAAFGGLVAGAILHLVFADGFSLLLGSRPPAIPGGMEGALLGFGLASGAALARFARRDLAPLLPALGAAAGGMAAVALGGHLVGGSLEAIAATFAASPLDLDPVGRLLGSTGFDRRAETIAAGIECALFGALVYAAIARRALPAAREDPR